MLLLSVGLAQPLPADLHGRYASAEQVNSWFGTTPIGSARAVEVRADHLSVDQVFTVPRFEVLEPRSELTWALRSEFGEEAVARFERSGAYARLRFNDSHDVQLDRKWKAFRGLDLQVLATGALLSHGYLNQGEPLVVAARGHGKHRVFGAASLQGGFSVDDRLVLDDVLYQFTVDQRGILLEEAEEEGPELMAVDGGSKHRLRRMKQPPFIVLADRLNLRAEPRAAGELVGGVDGGRWVRVWQEKEGWLLVQDGATIGWGSAAYVGRRVEPAGGEVEGEPLVLEDALLEGQPIRLHREGCDVGRTLLRPTGARRSTVRFVDLDGLPPQDALCLVEEATAWVVCPVLRAGAVAKTTPCGTVQNRPTRMGAVDTAAGRALVLDGKVLPPIGEGWFETETVPPEPDASDPTPQTTPPATGCGCATNFAPLAFGWMVPVGLRRRQE